ncbi:MAG: cytochrome b/b6 domain-containing protein [Alphaproteobacteria bacterium]|nr:cytochrome b/b6 domain-containing protein [Alphaproteobacteria bacterium]
MKSIVVWDLPTRAFHWALAASVILALIIIEDEGLAYTIHVILGVAALVLVLFRLVWGFAGGERARFTDFVAGWTTVRSHTLQLLRLAPPRHIGHNPLGGWAVLVLLALTLLAATTGVLTGGLLGSATARAVDGIHELFGSLLQLMVFIHIAGVIVDWVLTRDNIVAAMWHGRKRIEDTSSAVSARGGSVLLAAAIAVPLIVFGGYVMTQIDLTAAPGRSSFDSETG